MNEYPANEPHFSRGTVKQVAALMRRYRDAYRKARALVGIGSVIKSVGIFLALLFILIGFVIINAKDGPSEYFNLKVPFGIMAIVIGLLGGAIIYLIGILVSAHGQTLMATLDSAIYNSTFIVNEHRAILLSLPEE